MTALFTFVLLQLYIEPIVLCESTTKTDWAYLITCVYLLPGNWRAFRTSSVMWLLFADWSGLTHQRVDGSIRAVDDFSKMFQCKIKLPVNNDVLKCGYRSQWLVCINSLKCITCNVSLLVPLKCVTLENSICYCRAVNFGKRKFEKVCFLSVLHISG